MSFIIVAVRSTCQHSFIELENLQTFQITSVLIIKKCQIYINSLMLLISGMDQLLQVLKIFILENVCRANILTTNVNACRCIMHFFFPRQTNITTWLKPWPVARQQLDRRPSRGLCCDFPQ